MLFARQCNLAVGTRLINSSSIAGLAASTESPASEWPFFDRSFTNPMRATASSFRSRFDRRTRSGGSTKSPDYQTQEETVTLVCRIALYLLASVVMATRSAEAQPAPFQLVGFSTATFTSSRQIFSLTEACKVDFGPEARICTSAEAANTVILPSVPDFQTGWVRPGTVLLLGNFFVEEESLVSVAVSQSHPTAGSCFSCRGGEANGSGTPRGLFVSEAGEFGAAPCNAPLPVACCEPVALPEPNVMLLNSSGIATLGALRALGKRSTR